MFFVRIDLAQANDGRGMVFHQIDSMPNVDDIIDVDDLGTKARVTAIVDRKKPPLIRAELIEVAGKSVKR
jgi:hypothetical protein